MKVKVFQPNSQGKIEFTCAELEKLLNEVYSDGYREGKFDAHSHTWTWTTPYYDNKDLNATDNQNTVSNTTTAVDNFKAKLETAKPFTVQLNINEADINKAAESLNSLLNQNLAPRLNEFNDVFSNLAKELGV